MLTEYQQQIVDELCKGSLIHTTEGKNYRCWLQSSTGEKRIIRKDTVGLLFDKGYIKEVTGISNVYFTYKIKEKLR